MKRNAIVAAAFAVAISGMAAQAALVDVTKIKKIEVGADTPYGETAAERANKQVTFDWVSMMMVDRKPKEAFEKYVSKDFCDWSMAGLNKPCGNANDTLNGMARMFSQPQKPGELSEVPTAASVNGEMVTHFGAGVDIFQVKNGKVVAHWDASPPAEVTIKAHHPDFTKWVTGDRKGPPPGETGPSDTQVTVTQAMLTSVNTGPIGPYGETAKEMANKRTVFEWNHMSMIQGKRKEAFEKYVDKKFCDHSHMITAMKKECGTWDEVANNSLMTGKPAKVGDKLEMPTMATVNGEMVTMYGKGIDVFRVQNGKITDHWDASPPVTVTIKAHSLEQVEREFRVKLGLLDASFGRGGMNAAPGGAQQAPK
ncbi:MAG: hypothetical protein QM808_09385 [Steroidobacteraceae bacterium]